MRTLVPFAIFAMAAFYIVQAPAAQAQRKIIGADETTDAGPAPAPAAPSPAPVSPAAAAAERAESARRAAEKKAKEDEAKAAAEKAAEAAAEAAKQQEAAEQQKLADDKKAADAKKRLENRDQRLAAAKKMRQLTRTSGSLSIWVALEPGQVQKDALLEVRLDIAKNLDVPDPRYGNLLPVKGAELTAIVNGAKGRVRYVLHPLETPGRYGFHSTPAKDGPLTVQINGTMKDGTTVDATFPVYVGVWPPPDFEDEEKNASRGGNKVVGGKE